MLHSELAASHDVRYPIGCYHAPDLITAATRAEWTAELQSLPGLLRNATQGLSERQLKTPYRVGGWSVRQLVHHFADSHRNSYARFRLALTEYSPTIKP